MIPRPQFHQLAEVCIFFDQKYSVNYDWYFGLRYCLLDASRGSCLLLIESMNPGQGAKPCIDPNVEQFAKLIYATRMAIRGRRPKQGLWHHSWQTS